MNSTLRGPVVWMALVVVMVLIWSVAGQFQAGDNSVSFTECVRWVDAGQVESARRASAACRCGNRPSEAACLERHLEETNQVPLTKPLNLKSDRFYVAV